MTPPHSGRGHAHRRSASREMGFVMDFADSCSLNPFPGLGGTGGSTMENVIPPRPNTKQETEVAPHQTLVDKQKPGLKPAKLTVAKELSNPMATPVESPEREHAESMTEESISMTLVSPPFSPTTAEASFVASDSKPQAVDKDVDPLQLSASETQRVRSQLEEELPNVFCESRARIPTTNGTEIFLHVYRNDIDLKEHLAIVFGNDIRSKSLFAPRDGETEHDRMTRGAYTGTLFPGRENSMESEKSDASESRPRTADVLCRIHSECYTGETAWSARCDCGEQLDEAARLMAEDGHGVIVYLRQEGRGIGLGEKLKAYNLQDLGADTVQANLMLRHPADGRSFGLATAILKDLGLDHIRLMTNNPDKIVAVEGKHHDITVTQRVPMIPLSWQNKGGFHSKEVDKYLSTKIERMGHLLQQ